jgi:hypothetical protein
LALILHIVYLAKPAWVSETHANTSEVAARHLVTVCAKIANICPELTLLGLTLVLY